jgi:hypothetical protein
MRGETGRRLCQHQLFPRASGRLIVSLKPKVAANPPLQNSRVRNAFPMYPPGPADIPLAPTFCIVT